MTKRLIAPGAVALLLGLAACTNPYDPAQRAVGGGLIGAGAGAAIGAAAAAAPARRSVRQLAARSARSPAWRLPRRRPATTRRLHHPRPTTA